MTPQLDWAGTLALNGPPAIDPIGDQAKEVDQTAAVDIVAPDPGGGDITFSLQEPLDNAHKGGTRFGVRPVARADRAAHRHHRRQRWHRFGD